MNMILMKVVTECCAFFALSDDDAVDPDVAVAQLEQVAAILKGLSPEDRGSFERYIRDLVRQERATGASRERIAFLEALPEDLGISA